MTATYFETRALEARERRRREAEVHSPEDFAPIQVHELSLTRFSAMQVKTVKAMLEPHGVIVLHDMQNQVYAMVIPPSFSLLLEVADVLKDTSRFQLVDRVAIAREIGLPG